MTTRAEEVVEEFSETLKKIARETWPRDDDESEHLRKLFYRAGMIGATGYAMLSRASESGTKDPLVPIMARILDTYTTAVMKTEHARTVARVKADEFLKTADGKTVI